MCVWCCDGRCICGIPIVSYVVATISMPAMHLMFLCLSFHPFGVGFDYLFAIPIVFVRVCVFASAVL